MRGRLLFVAAAHPATCESERKEREAGGRVDKTAPLEREWRDGSERRLGAAEVVEGEGEGGGGGHCCTHRYAPYCDHIASSFGSSNVCFSCSSENSCRYCGGGTKGRVGSRTLSFRGAHEVVAEAAVGELL